MAIATQQPLHIGLGNIKEEGQKTRKSAARLISFRYEKGSYTHGIPKIKSPKQHWHHDMTRCE